MHFCTRKTTSQDYAWGISREEAGRESSKGVVEQKFKWARGHFLYFLCSVLARSLSLGSETTREQEGFSVCAWLDPWPSARPGWVWQGWFRIRRHWRSVGRSVSSLSEMFSCAAAITSASNALLYVLCARAVQSDFLGVIQDERGRIYNNCPPFDEFI